MFIFVGRGLEFESIWPTSSFFAVFPSFVAPVAPVIFSELGFIMAA